MALTVVPLRAEPAQTLSVVLGGQNVSLRLFTRDYLGTPHLYCDVAVDSTVIWRGHICRNLQDIKLYGALGFEGVLRFIDQQGSEDPQWQGLGERFVLLWGTEQDWLELAA